MSQRRNEPPAQRQEPPECDPSGSLGPELFIGIVGAVGSDMDCLCDALTAALQEVNYTSTPVVRLSELFHGIPELGLPRSKEEFRRTTFADDRWNKYMSVGNDLRKRILKGDAAALLAVMAIREDRKKCRADENTPWPRHAYIIRSLKHLDEVRALREIYRSSFLLLGVYSRRDQRVQQLARIIADSRYSLSSVDYRESAEGLVNRDEKESDPFGQNVRNTFPEADFFVDVDDGPGMSSAVSRFVHLLFGDNRFTPTHDEQGMFFAKGASLRSSSLSRQVGAAITKERGEVLAVGTNEVPRGGGGTYWDGDEPDGRDVARGYDVSDQFKRNTLGEVLKCLQEAGWFGENHRHRDVDALLRAALDEKWRDGETEKAPPLRHARIMDIIEYGRTVHAEMTAITDAARLGVSVADARLYTTTFPCHDCARHIVAAGIREVVYVEPYAKSLAVELYPDSVAVEHPATGSQVPFVPFIGVAPRRYAEWFAMHGERKGARGDVLPWNPLAGLPRAAEEPIAYLKREQRDVQTFQDTMKAKGLSWVT